MNVNKGILGLAIVSVAWCVIVPLTVLAVHYDEITDKEAELLVGISILGPLLILGFWCSLRFVLKGFTFQKCKNCEKSIGRIEESFRFGTHLVCKECFKRLSKTQEGEHS